MALLSRLKSQAYQPYFNQPSQSVTEVPGRHLIYDGDLAELDPESFTAVGKVHIFLLNDSLMISTWLPHRCAQ